MASGSAAKATSLGANNGQHGVSEHAESRRTHKERQEVGSLQGGREGGEVRVVLDHVADGGLDVLQAVLRAVHDVRARSRGSAGEQHRGTVARVVAVIFMWGRLVAAVFVGVAAAVVGCMHPAAGIAEEDGEDSADGNRRERACVSAILPFHVLKCPGRKRSPCDRRGPCGTAAARWPRTWPRTHW